MPQLNYFALRFDTTAKNRCTLKKASAIDEVVEEGLFSRACAEEAVATLSSEDALNQYIADEENRAFLNEQYKRPDWLEHIWGRLDGKSLKEAWPQAYKEISQSVGRKLFRTKEKGGVAVDELADELKSLNMLPRDAGADELVEMLKGHENKNPRYGKEFFQSAEQAGTRNTTEAEEAARLWREKGTESPYFKKWFGNSKVVDENGKPLVVYHGGTVNDKFDASFNGSGGGREGGVAVWPRAYRA